MSIPIHILNSCYDSFQRCRMFEIEHKLFKSDYKPLDAHFIFNSTEELEDYIRNDGMWAAIGQVVLVDKDVYIVTKIGSNPEYHKLQTEEDKIKIDEKGNILK